MKPNHTFKVLILAVFMLSASARAWAWEYGGHFKYTFNATEYPDSSLATALADEQQTSQGLNTRLLFSERQGHWNFEAHYELNALHSNSNSLQTAQDPDQNRWLDLSHVFDNDSSDFILHRLDRLSLAYTDESLVMRLGRQAVSWGNGLV
ncbi:MAG: hypothetical protein OQL09_00155, partial [Gammaproteobacteria bacterium]|nr:hypothetical protein [Gammaproteobacteria bacterium]